MTDQVIDLAPISPSATFEEVRDYLMRLEVWRRTREPVSDGEVLNKFIPYSALESLGVLEFSAGGIIGGSTGGGGGGPSVLPPGLDYINDLTPPTPITGLTVSAGIAFFIVEFDAPTYSQGGGNDYTEIYAANWDGISALPTFANAVLVYSATGAQNVVAIPAQPGQTTHFWVGAVTRAGVKQVDTLGPTGGTNGVSATTGSDPAALLAILVGQIKETHLFSSLGARIDLIDASSAVVGSVNARIQTVQDQVNAITSAPDYDNAVTYAIGDVVAYDGKLYRAIAATTGNLPTNTTYWELVGDYASLAGVVAAHTVTLNDHESRIDATETGLTAEVTARETLAAQLRGSYTGTDPSALVTGLLFNERTVRVAAEDAIASNVTALSATVTSNFTTLNSAIATESTARATGDAANATLITSLQARVSSDVGMTSLRYWGFDAGLEGWIGSSSSAVWQADGTVTWTPPGANANFNKNTLPVAERFQGAAAPVVRARVKRLSGTGAWEGRCYYTTSGHGNVNDFTKQIPAPASPGEWNILEWDMAALTAGGTDWLDSEILGLRIDLVSDGGTSVWSFDWIAVGSTAITPTDARITTLAEVVATADTAAAGRLTALEASVNTPTTGNNPTYAAVIAEEIARAAGDSANASAITTLVARVEGSGANLVDNSSFEVYTGTNGIADGWTTYAGGTTGTVTRSVFDGLASHGARSQRVQASGLGGTTSDLAGVQSATTFMLPPGSGGGQFTVSGSVCGTAGAVGVVQVLFYDEDAVFISGGTITASVALTGLSAFTRIHATGTAPAGTVRARVRARIQQGPGGAVDFYVDAVQLQAGALTGYSGSDLAAALQTEATVRASETGALFGKYTVKIDLNGYVSGFGLASEANNGATVSDFIIRADRFSVASPSGPGLTPVIPFVVNTTTQTVGGVSVPPGIYMDAAFIKNGTISAAKIGNAVIDDAKIANVSAAKLTAGSLAVGAYAESTGYVPGSAGWRISGNGTAEFSGVLVRGTLLGGSATAYNTGLGMFSGWTSGTSDANYRWRVGNPSAARIQWTGSAVEVYNASNVLTFSSGTIIPTNTNQLIDGAGLGNTATWAGVSGIPYETIVSNDDAVALGFNPAFAAWTGTYPAGWENNVGGAAIVKETALVRIGPNAVRFATGGTNRSIRTTAQFDGAPMPEGTFVAGTVDMRIVSVAPGNGTARPGVRVLLYYTSALGSSRFTDAVADIAPAAIGQWQRIPFTARLNAGERIHGIRVVLYAAHTHANYQGLFDGDVVYDNLRLALFDRSTDNQDIQLQGSAGTITITGAGGGSATGVVMPGNPINAVNISTYISAAAIGWAQIGDLVIGTGGGIRSGKATYGSGTGWLVEYNGGTPRLDIGGPDAYMRWTGTELQVRGLTTLGPVPTPPPVGSNSISAVSGTRTASASVETNGTLGRRADAGAWTTVTNWWKPTTAGVGTGRYVRFTLLQTPASTVTVTGSFGSWAQINAQRVVSIQRNYSAFGQDAAVIGYEIASDSGGTNIISSGYIYLNIGYIA